MSKAFAALALGAARAENVILSAVAARVAGMPRLVIMASAAPTEVSETPKVWAVTRKPVPRALVEVLHAQVAGADDRVERAHRLAEVLRALDAALVGAGDGVRRLLEVGVPDRREALALRERVHRVLVVHADGLEVVERGRELHRAVLPGGAQLEHLGRELLDVLRRRAGLRLQELLRVLELGRHDDGRRAHGDDRQRHVLGHAGAHAAHGCAGALDPGGRREHPGGRAVAGQGGLLLHAAEVADRLVGAGAAVGRDDGDEDGHYRAEPLGVLGLDGLDLGVDRREARRLLVIPGGPEEPAWAAVLGVQRRDEGLRALHVLRLRVADAVGELEDGREHAGLVRPMLARRDAAGLGDHRHGELVDAVARLDAVRAAADSGERERGVGGVAQVAGDEVDADVEPLEQVGSELLEQSARLGQALGLNDDGPSGHPRQRPLVSRCPRAGEPRLARRIRRTRRRRRRAGRPWRAKTPGR